MGRYDELEKKIYSCYEDRPFKLSKRKWMSICSGHPWYLNSDSKSYIHYDGLAGGWVIREKSMINEYLYICRGAGAQPPLSKENNPKLWVLNKDFK